MVYPLRLVLPVEIHLNDIEPRLKLNRIVLKIERSGFDKPLLLCRVHRLTGRRNRTGRTCFDFDKGYVILIRRYYVYLPEAAAVVCRTDLISALSERPCRVYLAPKSGFLAFFEPFTFLNFVLFGFDVVFEADLVVESSL